MNDAVSEPALIEKLELRADGVWQGALPQGRRRARRLPERKPATRRSGRGA
jgi:hypothetical protein